MASLPKSTFTKFVDDWNGRKQWAQSAGISFNNFAATVHYDYQRMTNSQGFGEKMSDTEAFDAMTSLQKGQNPFKTPADTAPNVFSNPLGAVRNDIQGIMTGLFHAPQAIFHDFDQAVHGHFGGIAQLLPGYSDITDLFSPQGRQFLIQHPVSDMLDFMGAGKIADLGEAALRNAGADEAANLLKQFPDHPIAKGLSKTFNMAADHVQTIAALKEHGTSILGGMGQLPIQKDLIFRPMRAINRTIRQFAANPENFKALSPESIKIGVLPAGEPIYSYMDSKAEGMTKPQIWTAINYANHQIIDPTDPSLLEGGFDPSRVVPATQFFDDPTIPESVKNLYRSFEEAQTSLQGAKWLELHDIKPVTHGFKSGEIGWVKSTDNAWERYERKFNRTMAKASKDSNDLRSAINTVYAGIKHLKEDDAGLPQALRLPGDTTVNMSTSLRRAGDYFRVNGANLFNREVITGIDRRAQSDFLKSVNRVMGPDSPLQSIINKIGSLENTRDPQLIRDIRSVRRSLLRLNTKHDAAYVWLDSTLSDIQDTVHNMGIDQPQIGKLRDQATASIRRANTLRKSYDLNWNKYTQSAYTAMVQREFRKIIGDHLNQHYNYLVGHGQILERKGIVVTPETIENVITEAENKNYASISDVMTPADFNRFKTDAYLSVNNFKAAGAKPLFVTGVSRAEEQAIAEGRYGSITDISKNVRRSTGYERQPTLTSTIFNPVYGIPKEVIGIYRQQLVKAYQQDFASELTMSSDSLISYARTYFKDKVPEEYLRNTEDLAYYYARKHGFVPYNPNQIFGGTFEKGLANPETTWIKNYNLKMMHSTISELDEGLNKAWDKVMQVYRFGVLKASPRYAAHLIAGGGFLTALRLINPIVSPVKYAAESWQMAADAHSMGLLISHGVAEQDARGAISSSPFRDQMANSRAALIDNPQGTHLFLVGRKLAQLYHQARTSRLGEAAGSTFNSYTDLLERGVNFQRALTYVEGREHATIHPDLLTPEIRVEAKRWNTTPEQYYGATLARKSLADMDAVSPMERAVIMRYVIPFWGWTRHIVRYVATYPADHPLRASIIQSVSNQAIGENSYLPEYLFRLLFLGQPNAQGNVTVLDDRQWNPLRDVANYMTWGGIMSTLNPVLQAVTASAWGVNSATGGPDLFPQLTFDTFYGSESAQPTGGNFFVDVAKQISPQIDTLLNVAKSTSSLREEAAAHPGTLGYLIGDSMGLPWIPERLNVKQIAIEGTTDEEVLASAAVQKALQSNSMAPLQGYAGLLPLSGYEVDKNYIAQLINQALAWNKSNPQGGGVQISALDLLSLPYASQYAPEVLLGKPGQQ